MWRSKLDLASAGRVTNLSKMIVRPRRFVAKVRQAQRSLVKMTMHLTCFSASPPAAEATSLNLRKIFELRT